MSGFKLLLILSGAYLMHGCIEPSRCNNISNNADYYAKYKNESVVKFMVTADPQYNIKEMNPNHISVRNSDSVSVILAEKICKEDYRGVVISGDLTHNARADEYEKYLEFIEPFRLFVFDGLGNHDYSWATEENKSASEFIDFGLDEVVAKDKLGWDVACLSIWDDVRERKRIPSVHSSFPNIHYSWDWGDVHGVQLNVYPGVKHKKGKLAQNPLKSFDFLKRDLEEHVGTSGRPVILSHHYGFDYFSLGASEEGGESTLKGSWWLSEDRTKYWELLKPYNVIAIFSGHAHYCDQCYLPWDGEHVGEGKVGPDFIPTFVSGAAREGNYLECQITTDSLIVKRYTLRDVVFRKAFDIQRNAFAEQ